MKLMRYVLPVALSMFTVACGSESGTPANTKAPRVFFIEPTAGATGKSPVHLRFGAENFMIMPVPAGEVTTVRPGMGHHHLGVDQDCLPAGANIVKGTPSWVHFGDGKTEMDLQLTPGTHKLSLQLGDDMQNTMANLCQTITVNVTEP